MTTTIEHNGATYTTETGTNTTGKKGRFFFRLLRNGEEVATNYTSRAYFAVIIGNRPGSETVECHWTPTERQHSVDARSRIKCGWTFDVVRFQDPRA